MGGVLGVGMRGESELILPDPSATNCGYHVRAADFVFRRCQELLVSMVVIGRAAAYAASLPAFIYDELATVGHPVALHLRESQVRGGGAAAHARCPEYPGACSALRALLAPSRAAARVRAGARPR